MSDVATPAAIYFSAAGGITIFGIATGLDPALLFAGACGGYWGLLSMPPQGVWARTQQIIMGALAAAWLAPPLVVWWVGEKMINEQVTHLVWQYAAALLVGLVAVPVLGRAVIGLAKRKIDEVQP